jgi:phosphoglycerate dehydrogenase-like enzyme
MSNPTVFVTMTLTDDELSEMKRAAPAAAFRYFGDKAGADLEREIGDAEILLGRGDASTISPEGLSRATRLRWIHSWAAGPNELLFPGMLESPVILTSSVGSGAIGMAEHAVMLMLMLNRGTVRWIHAQDEHRWERGVHGELYGLTLGIIGLGNTGRDLALKAQAFHMRVIGMRRNPQPTPNVDEVFTRDRLDELLQQADFVVVTAPRTAETTGMLGEREFRLMKPSAYFVASSRGGIADEAALLQALKEGWIAGAGLDAFAEEPLPPDHPLWTAQNTIVTPHIGAQSPRRRRASLEMFLANLQRYLAGEPLVNVVDKQAGY